MIILRVGKALENMRARETEIQKFHWRTLNLEEGMDKTYGEKRDTYSQFF